MDVIESIYGRRSVKQFDPEHKMSTEEETKLMEAVIQSPTSFNIQHWRFVVLRDPHTHAGFLEAGKVDFDLAVPLLYDFAVVQDGRLVDRNGGGSWLATWIA